MLSEVVLVDSGLGKPSEEAPASLPGKRYPAGRLHLARCLADEHHTLTAPEDIGDVPGMRTTHGQTEGGVPGIGATPAGSKGIKVGMECWGTCLVGT